jgi:hypothetical protein
MSGSGENTGRAGDPARPLRSWTGKVWASLITAIVVSLTAFAVWRALGSTASAPPRHQPSGPPAEGAPSARPLVRERRPSAAPRPLPSDTARAPRKPAIDEAKAWVEVLGCWDENACPSGTVCWLGDDGKLGCFESNCRSAADREHRCPDGQACRAVSKLEGIYRCMAGGSIPLGGSCLDPSLATPARSCEAGLLCVNMLCRQPCGPGTRACPSGDVCVQQTVRDWACLPGCSSDADCGENTCVRPNGVDRGSCVKVTAGTCRPDRLDSCPSGEICDYSIIDGRMLTGVCRRSCSANSCPAGSICWAGFDAPAGVSSESLGVCLQACSAQQRECPADHVCMALDVAGASWGCRRAAHDARPAVDIAGAQGSFADSVASPR